MPCPRDSDAESAESTSQTAQGRPTKQERECTICARKQALFGRTFICAEGPSCEPCYLLSQQCVYVSQNCIDRRYKKIWEKMDNGRRADFIRSVKGLRRVRVPELTTRMTEFLSNDISSMLTTFAGLLLDLSDFKSNYMDKPEQKLALRRYTNKFVWLVSECDLLLSPVCQGSDDEEIRTKRRRMFRQNSTVASEGSSQATVASGADRYHTKLDEKQTTELDDLLTIMSTAEKRLIARNEEIIGLGMWIAPVAKIKLAELQLFHRTMQDVCIEMQMRGECIDFPGFIETMSVFQERFHSQMACIDTHVDQGRSTKIAYGIVC